MIPILSRPRIVLTLILFVLSTMTLACAGYDRVLLGVQAYAKDDSVLFEDDFSDRTSGWSIMAVQNNLVGYDGGRFRFYLLQPYYTFWSTPGKVFSDVSVEADAVWMGGPANNAYGLICRYRANQGFYAFLITSDGYYGIAKAKGDKMIPLGPGMVVSHKVPLNEKQNHLRAYCAGSQLALWANGNLLTAVEDSDYPSGDVGLMAETFSQPGVDVAFKKFIVKKMSVNP